MSHDPEALVWEDPPSKPANRRVPLGDGKWERALAPLMDRPGEWARIADGSSEQMRNLAGQLSSGRRRRPPGVWAFTARTDPQANTGACYARYLGPERAS